jgi:Ca-activated chloride channel homolog
MGANTHYIYLDMRKAGVVAALFLAGICVLAVTVRLTADSPQGTFRAGIDAVSFAVTVTDGRGAFVTDLTPADFELIEDGRPQPLTYFARGDTDGEAPELHIGLLFDTSGSMGGDIALARTAAIRFLNTLTDAKDITLVDFATEVRIARFGQDDFPRLVERIRGRRPSGMTAMYDALGVYLDGASAEEGRTILVIFTDGGDTRSSISYRDVLTLVRASDVTIYTVGFLARQSGRAQLMQRAQLAELAGATGGQAFFPSSMRDIELAYDRVVAQIRAQYTLGYISTNPARDGRWRRVEVRVRRPGLRGARVQARDGYFAPYGEGQ